MTGDLRFSWELSGTGWATYRIADGTSERKDHVSYCTDALADLLFGVAGLYGPSSVQRISFDLEPAEARWVLRSRGQDVEILIYLFADMSTSFDLSDGQGEFSWGSTQPRSVVGHTVMRAAQTVLRQHGEDGYRKKWMQHPFPVSALQDLARLHLRDEQCRLEHDPVP
ncbi:hypothetical protein [Streptomyces sp. LN704]|uniref:hypothetical protein n=1 Tax=unclassified Streptomyces TaxID=2593676 RepID=UPI0037218F54